MLPRIIDTTSVVASHEDFEYPENNMKRQIKYKEGKEQ